MPATIYFVQDINLHWGKNWHYVKERTKTKQRNIVNIAWSTANPNIY